MIQLFTAPRPCLTRPQVLKLEGTFSFAAPEYVRIWKGFQKAQLIEATSFKVRGLGRALWVHRACSRMLCAVGLGHGPQSIVSAPTPALCGECI